MSRRYGRNQKRAAREREASLHQALVETFADRDRIRRRADGAESTVSRLREVIEEWDADIHSLLGPYTSFAIEDRTFRVDRVDQVREMPIYPTLHLPVALVSEQVPEMLEYHVQRIYMLIADELSDTDRSRLQRYLSLRVQVGSDRPVAEAYFAVSADYWRHLQQSESGRERVARNIAPDLVRLIAAPPKKEERRQNGGK